MVTKSLRALWTPTTSWTSVGPLDFVLPTLRVLRLSDPRGKPEQPWNNLQNSPLINPGTTPEQLQSNYRTTP